MRKSTRLLILTAIVELLLVAGAAYMLVQIKSGAWPTFDQAEAVNRVLSVMGMAIGGIGGAFLFVAFILRRRGA